jgi:hypothetical protein
MASYTGFPVFGTEVWNWAYSQLKSTPSCSGHPKMNCTILKQASPEEGVFMRRFLVLLGSLAFLSISARAQGPAGVGAGGSQSRSPSHAGSEYAGDLSQWQLSMGYQYNRINLTGIPFTTSGLNVSATRYFTSWFGVEGQAGFGFGNTGATTNPSNLAVGSAFLGAGPRLAFRGHSRIEPWVHAIAGLDHYRFTQTVGVLGSNTGFAGLGGGGIDVRLNSHTSFRVGGDVLESHFFSMYQRSFQAVSTVVVNF